MTYLSTPRFLLSTSSSPILPGSSYLDVGGKMPLSGIDLDNFGSIRFRLQRWSSVDPLEAKRIHSVWIPADAPLLSNDPLTAIGPVQLGSGARPLIVVDRPEHRSRDDLANQVATAIRLRQTIGELARIGIAVRPYHPNGARAHLSAIAGLRMQASEWDIDIVLDLSKDMDWLWEAEASVYRMMPSLQLVRIAMTAGTLDGRFRASLTDRALSSCAELGFDGMISLVTPVPWWHWRNERTIEAFCRDATGRVIRKFSRHSSTGEYTTELSAPVEFE
ncbi:MAG: hypothetical protein KC438_13790 [Thermomicrobiales bacterium]|nr:hypothetical protein [Thermomicrobiales bacterium]MCO5221330.1 hypothetical protein [Thermomicrobiales bacterium]